MIDKLLSFFGLDNAWSTLFGNVWSMQGSSRRAHLRYAGVQAEVLVGDRIYSVRDWSMGGFSFDTPSEPLLETGQDIQVVIKFRFPHDTITIRQQARIVRALKRGVAAEFQSLPATTRREFKRIVDSMHAQSFLESQIV